MPRNSIVMRKENHLAEKKESKKEDVVYIFTPYITKKMGQEYMQVNMVKRHLEFQKKTDNLCKGAAIPPLYGGDI